MKQLAILILCLLGMAAPASAQKADTVVSLVNFYPGKIIYELEGHTVLRVQLPDGTDVAVSYGVFDFNSPNFLYRFVKGETDYMAAAYPWQRAAAEYLRDGRRTVEHRLDLNSEQKRRLVSLLEENLRPENRTYRYNYVKDNCATRPLRMVELAMADSIELGPSALEADAPTFRSIMRHFHANYPWYQFGIDLALGSGIDYPIDRRELAFAPAVLDEQIATATVGGKPLVSETIVTLDTAPDAAIEGPTPWYATPLTVFRVLFVLIAIVGVRDMNRKRLTRWVYAAFYGALGIVGLLLTFLIFISVHEATSPNWLYLAINPLCLIPAIFIWSNRTKSLVKCYQIANFALLFAFGIALAVSDQSLNPAMTPLLMSDVVLAICCVRIIPTCKSKA